MIPIACGACVTHHKKIEDYIGCLEEKIRYYRGIFRNNPRENRMK